MQIIRLLQTIRYLKFEQLFYQIKYRTIGYSKGKATREHSCCEKFSILVDELDMDALYLNRFCPEDVLNNTIYLLNESFGWEPNKWENKCATHLWNFNLHYFEYAIALASRYKLTGDNRYFEKFKELYQNWWKCFGNKVSGDAWHPYTISLRIPNLIICSELFKELLEEDLEFKKQIFESLYTQYCFLDKNQEKNLLGNHYFENLKALYIGSVLFQESEKRKKYEKALLREISIQILSDGMHYERSMMYHNIILEDLIRIERASWYSDNHEFQQKIVDTIQRMSDVICSIEDLKIDRIPLFNDAGSGVAKSAKQIMRAIGSLYGYVPMGKTAFADAGYYVLKRNGIKVLFDCGEMGPSYITGHGHCDVLSFELFIEGQPVLVNAGTYHYQTELRSYFRSTKSHNTIQIGDNEQADCWGEHRTADRYKVLDVQQNSNDSVRGSVQYVKGDIVSREIELTDKEVIIHDSITKRRSKQERVCSYYRVHPACSVGADKDKNTVQIYASTKQFVLVVDKDSADVIVHTDSDICWYSEAFGKKEKTYVLEIRWKEQIDDITVILEGGR